MTLTHEQSIQRFKYIKLNSIKYNFYLYLNPKQQHFKGLAQISFALKAKPQKYIELDFKGIIKSLKFNHLKSNTIFWIHQNSKIFIDPQPFQINSQIQLTIFYQASFRSDGLGCNLYYDSRQIAKNQPFLHTQFQTYQCNKVFPCFDQPDLKATMILNTIIDQSLYTIFSNENAIVQNQQFTKDKFIQKIKNPIQNKQLLEDFLSNINGKIFIFPETKILPTYLFGFTAGKYDKIIHTKQHQTRLQKRKIPISVIAASINKKQLQFLKDFVFQITIQALKFFQKYFGHDLVFNKLDFVFVQDLNDDGMQNAGLITMKQSYLYTLQNYDFAQTIDFANTIIHEISHHWFGNFVTLKWWDDLWLNQSFADFITWHCMQNIKNNLTVIKYDSAMLEYFYAKQWGYNLDSYSNSTHPIRMNVSNTAVVDQLFDGITYKKGGAALKQLKSIIGDDNFQKALTQIFNDQKFKFGNSSFDQFMLKMKPCFKDFPFSFDQWKQIWFMIPSFNIISCDWNPKSIQKRSTLSIIQTCKSEQYTTLRPHKITISFYKIDGAFKNLQVILDNDGQQTSQTIIQYDGSQNYQGVLLDSKDQSFVQIKIDQTSLNFFSQILNNMPTLHRALVWKYLYDSVQENQLQFEIYFNDFLIKHIPKQRQITILRKILEKNAFSLIEDHVQSTKKSNEIHTKVFNLILQMIQKISLQDKLSSNQFLIQGLKTALIRHAFEQQTVQCLALWKIKAFPPLNQIELYQDEIKDIQTKMSDLKIV